MGKRVGPRLRESRLLAPSAAVGEFTQPRAHSFAHLCTLVVKRIEKCLICNMTCEFSRCLPNKETCSHVTSFPFRHPVRELTPLLPTKMISGGRDAILISISKCARNFVTRVLSRRGPNSDNHAGFQWGDRERRGLFVWAYSLLWGYPYHESDQQQRKEVKLPFSTVEFGSAHIILICNAEEDELSNGTSLSILGAQLSAATK